MHNSVPHGRKTCYVVAKIHDITIMGVKTIMMKKRLFLLGAIIVAMLSVSAISALVSATTTNTFYLSNKKFAIAQWYVTTEGGTKTFVINAIVNMSNSEKDGWIYISIKHKAAPVSVASAPVEFKWSMNHVTLEKSLKFGEVLHNVIITWQTDGPTSHSIGSVKTGIGIEAILSGAWKSGSAEMTLDPSGTGYHKGNIYSTAWTFVAKGDATIKIDV